MSRVVVMRVIHGWGSSGIGGSIKSAVRAHLATAVRARRIRAVIPGDDYSELTNRGRELLQAYPALRSLLRTDRENPGITFIEI